jgi:hypothetical protein
MLCWTTEAPGVSGSAGHPFSGSPAATGSGLTVARRWRADEERVAEVAVRRESKDRAGTNIMDE